MKLTSYTGKINPEDCDLYGHMNTLKYIEKFYTAADVFLTKIGLSDPELWKIDLGVAYLEFNHTFIKECYVDEAIEIIAEYEILSSKVILLKQIMKYTDTEIVLAESNLKFLVFGLKSRKSLKLDDEQLIGVIKLS